jgi:haloalkane dehalogenase
MTRCAARPLGITGPVTLAVHDWGGMIGFGWALRDPSRVKRLVITNTASFPLPQSKRFPKRLAMGRDSKLGGWLIRKFNLFARGAAWFGTERRCRSRARGPPRVDAGTRRSARCASCRTSRWMPAIARC